MLDDINVLVKIDSLFLFLSLLLASSDHELCFDEFRCSHRCLCISDISEYKEPVLYEWHLPLLLIEQDNHLYVGSPTHSQERVRSLFFVNRGNAMTPVECYGCVLCQWGWGNERVQSVVRGSLRLINHYSV